MKRSQRISTFLADILPDSDDPPVEPDIHNDLERCWKTEIGIAAAHTYPLLFRSGKLVVFCESPAWSTQIRNQGPSIIRQLGEKGFEIVDIVTRITPQSTPSQASLYVKPDPQRMSSNSADRILESSKKLKHPNLQASLQKLAHSAKNKGQ